MISSSNPPSINSITILNALFSYFFLRLTSDFELLKITNHNFQNIIYLNRTKKKKLTEFFFLNLCLVVLNVP